MTEEGAPLPKRLLALDGGGVRGIITLRILARIEDVLRERLGTGDEFRLAHYFDYVGGTSTGAIIATCISLGMKVDEIQQFYETNAFAMFDSAGIMSRWRYKYSDEQLAAKLRTTFDAYLPDDEVDASLGRAGTRIRLGSSALKTKLLIMVRNATTDSPWPVSNNPAAKYNDRSRTDCNLDLPLWQLVRASTAAPTYFPPETVSLGDHKFVFVDGGITVYNNPAFMLFLMATIGPYQCGWPTGKERMLLTSVGTGTAPAADAELGAGDMNLLYNATRLPAALMFGAANEQDTLCRVFGQCRHGAEIDREIRALKDADDAGPHVPKLFTYLRYNAMLTTDGLAQLGLSEINAADVQQMDAVAHIGSLKRVGDAAAREVETVHFDHFDG